MLDEQANQRLARLENALLALKPQIEAMVTLQSKAQANSANPGSPTAEKVDPAPGPLGLSLSRGAHVKRTVAIGALAAAFQLRFST